MAAPGSFAGPLQSMAAALSEVEAELAFVLGELTSIAGDAGLIARVREQCSAILDSVSFDVEGEVRTLGDKLDPEGGHLEPGINPDPLATLSMITAWLNESLSSYHALVRSVTEAREEGHELLGVLLQSAGVNIIASHRALIGAADAIRAACVRSS